MDASNTSTPTPAVSTMLELMTEDLARSGLTPPDLMSRLLDEASTTAVSARPGTKGYVIPYFDMRGKMIPYYRVKVFDGAIKYLQLKATPNHVYFPKGFLEAWKGIKYRFVILTEGEKKAAIACKMGFPAVAFGGVDSWSNRTIMIPNSSEISRAGKALAVKLPSSNFDEQSMSALATGFQELMDIALKQKTTFLIVYDNADSAGVAAGPQRAAAKLGYELRNKGFRINQIRQIVLPLEDYEDEDGKTGLDDILVSDGGQDVVTKLIAENFAKRVAFPRHPNVREHIGKQLQKPKLDRRTTQNLSMSLLTELDSVGTRMYSPDDIQLYYFNGGDNSLMKVDINKPNQAAIHETDFGRLLYRDYGISTAADTKLMQWLGAQFSGEDPVENVSPHRVIAIPKEGENIVRMQISNGQYIQVKGSGPEPFKIMANGSEGILFESTSAKPIDDEKLMKELQRQFKMPLRIWWNDVIKEVRLKYPGKQGTLLALLYYISPYLLRWKGTQLPVEIITGEAGSGKSSLCEIRLNILTGDPELRNAPTEEKDWHAAIAHSGGLHVTDNVHMTDKNLKQRISDGLCRIVTEPSPRISMRKYFTEADERKIRIQSVFAFTAINQPFQNSDLLQRSIMLELSKHPVTTTIVDPHSKEVELLNQDVTFDGQWKDKQLYRFGGRTAWVAHQMLVLHNFFLLVEKEWNNDYRAKNRLVNLEQSLILMGKVFGIETDWIPDYLVGETKKAVTTADWALEGLIEWAQKIRNDQIRAGRKVKGDETKPILFDCADIANWASTSEDFEKCTQLITSRSLARYMQQNKTNIYTIAGIVEDSMKNNRLLYRTRPLKDL